MAKFDHDSRTSVNRQKKRRNQNILLATLTIILLILIIVLVINMKKQKVTEPESNNDISQIVNGETNDNEADDKANNNNSNENETNDNENNSDDDDKDKEKEVEMTEVETEDDNVEKAYIGDWEPVGTVQTGEHNTQFEEGSDDRDEIRKAIVEVTDIKSDDLIEYWIGNNGPDKVIATVADMPQDNIFRVYLSWVDKKGWQVTKLERLKEYNENMNDSVDIGEDIITKIEKDSE